MKGNTGAPSDGSSLLSILRSIFLKGNRSEIIAAVLVMAIVISMILPLPVWLLDVLIAVNISASCLLIILVMQLRETVQFSTFPALLLITTLFRVSLNVASTRQILLEGHAGHIIEAFGEVVVGGNIVVGLVVFCILTLVQFLVITKGSERVAEVGARFTLDAMPGKQLAIDIEAKAGNITPEEAQNKRSQLAMESQFFGAMDGALKFVKGDAIAGILITLTNLIGGMIVGITQRGMSAGDAGRLYSVLSIGDALVAQIPAILTSITAGLLITRISGASEQTTGHIGKQITQQLTANPKAWMTASVAMAAFGVVPGMPWYVFFALSAGSLWYGVHAFRKVTIENGNSKGKPSDFDEIREFTPTHPFLLKFGKNRDDIDDCIKLLQVARRIRNNLVIRYGLVAPAIETQSEVELCNAEAEFCHNEVKVFEMDIPKGHLVASCPMTMFEQIRDKCLKTEAHRWNPEKIQAWFPIEAKEMLIEKNIRYQMDWELIEKKVESALFRLAPKHFGVEQTSKLLKWLAATHPELAKELERAVPLQRYAEVLQRLMAERVSIRNVVRISEVLVEWGQRERDPAVLVECTRNGISREIANANSQNHELKAVLLDPVIETEIRDSIRQTAFGDFVSLDVTYIDGLTDSLFDIIKDTDELLPKVILTTADIRYHVRGLFQDRFEDVAVMSMPEIPSDFKVNVLGVIGGDAKARADR